MSKGETGPQTPLQSHHVTLMLRFWGFSVPLRTTSTFLSFHTCSSMLSCSQFAILSDLFLQTHCVITNVCAFSKSKFSCWNVLWSLQTQLRGPSPPSLSWFSQVLFQLNSWHYILTLNKMPLHLSWLEFLTPGRRRVISYLRNLCADVYHNASVNENV